MISNPELAAPVQNNDETYEELEKLVDRTGYSYDEARRLLGLPVEDPREVLSKIPLNLNSDNNPKLCSRSS